MTQAMQMTETLTAEEAAAVRSTGSLSGSFEQGAVPLQAFDKAFQSTI